VGIQNGARHIYMMNKDSTTVFGSHGCTRQTHTLSSSNKGVCLWSRKPKVTTLSAKYRMVTDCLHVLL